MQLLNAFLSLQTIVRDETVDSEATICGMLHSPGQPLAVPPMGSVTGSGDTHQHLRRLTNSLAKSYAAISQARARKEKARAERIDRLSRAGFPLAFLIFNIGYWIYYLQLLG